MTAPTQSSQSSLNEIRGLLTGLPGAAAPERAPAGAPALLDVLGDWLASWQGGVPRLDRPRLAIFAGAHGIAPGAVAPVAARIEAYRSGAAPANALCRMQDSDLRVYEMALDRPTADFRAVPALSDPDCAAALAYGMMAVEDGVELLCVAAMGAGTRISAAALCCGLFGGAPGDWRLPDVGPADTEAVIAAAVARHAGAGDALQRLRCLGGHELAAVAGAILAARMARVPVVLDGFAATAAAAVLHELDGAALDHCIVGHREAGDAHARLLSRLEKEALLDLDPGSGAGCGAMLALGVLRGALACRDADPETPYSPD
ncbi:MAG: nicotinate-nucleotide--dimethylbenzimidazole phosphoribosyltransferase [Alphaproteobacteria bacterium]|nr:nicotinate-nucleotide--dimethylbenzimidazole phosphoribosyltransferase [Alphaproteobacteria bacterium]